MDDIERAARITLVTDVISRLAQTADFGTLDEYASLLADDVVWEHSGNDALPAQVRRGKPDALIGARERRESGIQGPGSRTLHVLTNISVDPGEREATSMAYWHFVTGLGASPRISASGTYHDRFVRTPAGWLLAQRRITPG